MESLAVVVWEEGGKSPGSWRQAKDGWVIITKKKGKVIRSRLIVAMGYRHYMDGRVYSLQWQC